jgi:hypothetical protein
MPLVPKALRRVSMVDELCTMTAFASFHAAYAGSGRGPAAAAGAVDAGAAWPADRVGRPPRPAAAMALALPASSWRRRREGMGSVIEWSSGDR